MIVADPPVTEVEIHSTCGKVLPARSLRHCTRARADALLERGYCMCSEVAQEVARQDAVTTGGLAALAPATQELYRELVELSEEPLPLAEETLPEIEAVQELEEPPQRPKKRQRRRKKGGTQTRTVEVVELRPVADPNSDTMIWAHPVESPTAGTPPIQVFDGGGMVTGPHPLPELPDSDSEG